MRHLPSSCAIVALLTASINTQEALAQGNCDLITSATLSVSGGPSFVGVAPYILVNGLNDVPFAINEQQWQYIAITKDGQNQGKVYLNGQLVIQGDYANVSYSWNRIDLGAVFFTGWGGWFNGQIDEVRMSNVVRTGASILASYNSNAPLPVDANTIGLWHFDQSSGSTILATAGSNGTITNATWDPQGRFGQCLSFNGTNARATINQAVPTSNMTFEFWIKPSVAQASWPISWYGFNTAGFNTNNIVPTYVWSTGDTTTSVTVDPNAVPYVWVTNGTCTDTVWFNGSQIDTVLVTVTDTLLINTTITGINPPNNVNTIRVFPNPALDHVTVDFGNYGLMSGYSFRITNDLGQVVYMSPISQQSVYLSLGQWTGVGLYFVEVLDPMNQTVQVRHIVIQ